MSKVTDWAEQQSSDSSGFTYSTNPKADDKAVVLAESLNGCQSRTSRIYSISTLLRLRQPQQPARVELRIIPAALAESVFKVPSAAPRPKLHENLDPRRQTQSSSLTDRSAMSESDLQYDKAYVRPLRQPRNPPETSLLQNHAGFARFLRQHASPPHHRVTAGGRIVPVGPPPMMSLPSINGVLNGQPNNFKPTVGSPAIPLAQQNANVNAQKPSNFPHQVNHGLDGVAYPQYTQMQSPLLDETGSQPGPLPPGTIPLTFYPDGTLLVYLNGTHYQTHWDGNSLALRPVPYQVPFRPDNRYTSAVYPQAVPPIQHYLSGNINGCMTGSVLQNGNVSAPAHTQGQLQQSPQSEDPQALHTVLTEQLNALDRYVALRMHEFSHAENAGYAAQRKQLVEQIDGLRVSTENSKPPIMASALKVNEPINNIYRAPLCTGSQQRPKAAPLTNAAQHPSMKTISASGQYSTLNLFERLAPPQTPQNTLSPDAPPFVPTGMKAPFPDYFGPGYYPRTNSNQHGERKLSAKVQSSTNTTSEHNHGEKATPIGSRIGSINSVNTALRTNVERQVSTALPIVAWRDVQYASQPGINPTKGPKIYCTTISEFQEVIRRVREQATLYGCQGGQSKDPAYDAEQDIRWAMADCDPIPLPKSPPDHVAFPRPWSWDDSAFNYRPTVKINPDCSPSKADPKPHIGSENVVGDLVQTQTNNQAAEPRIGVIAGGPTVAARPTYHTSDLSSPSHLRQTPNKYGSQQSHRSSFQSYSSNSNGPMGNSNAPRAGPVPTWVSSDPRNSNDARVSSGGGFSNEFSNHVRVSSDARFHQQSTFQMGTPRKIEPGSRANSHSQQYQPYMQVAPQTPTKSNVYSGINPSVAGFSGRPHGSQQTQTPHQNSGRSSQSTSQPKLKHKDSWYSEVDSEDSWFATSDKDSGLPVLKKDMKTSQVLQQSQCEVSPSHAQNTTHYNTPISNKWATTPGSRGRNSDALSFDSQGIPRSDFNYQNKSTHDSLRAAKVNLPQAHRQPMFNQPLQTSPSVADRSTGGGVMLNNFAGSPSNTSSQGFLRGMLKSPRYSAARIRQSEPIGLTQGHAVLNVRAHQNRERQHANKENVKSDGYQDTMGWRSRRRGSSLSSGEVTNPWENQDSDNVTNKARSSLAGSSQHAFGQLPQYDGAGDALMGANDQAQTTAASACGPSTSKRQRKKKAKAKASEIASGTQYMSRAEKAKSYEVGLTIGYDYRGLTKEKFLPAPDRAGDMRAHSEYIDLYIDQLREEELDEHRALDGGDLVNQRRL